ncbi:MAG TPA: 2-hydroxyacyl-CoA dehydratase [Dehalococcoidia bacterium]|nr:2-hydroxyacyl-CoA dehydratase [Dehalococcoidia bacterium]
MANYYDELLKLCGFEDDEIKREKPRIDKAFQKLEIGPADMETAENWVRQNHEVELVGVRKLLGAWLKELIDLVLAKDEGKKVVYYGFPSIAGPGMAIKAAAQEAVYCACPDVVLCHTVGQIFNKLTPILEAGEENGLPPGHGLCSLQQIRVGGLAKGIIPVPDLVTGSSYYCDMGSKADELLHEKYGHRAVYVDGSMDSRWGEYPDYLPQRVEFLGAQLNKLFDTVKEVIGVEITGDAWDKALSIRRQLYRGIKESDDLMKADPMPVSQAEIGLVMWLASGCTGRAMDEGPRAVATLNQEIKKRVDEGIGVVEKGAPRVMIISTHFSDASVTRMIENAGLALCATVFSTPPPKAESETTYTSLGEIITEREMAAGIYHSSYGMAERTAKAIEDLNIDGVIWNYLFNCRPSAMTSHFVKKWVEENIGIPVLSLETDVYDSRSYSAATMRTKVETFAEILRARKASARV